MVRLIRLNHLVVNHRELLAQVVVDGVELEVGVRLDEELDDVERGDALVVLQELEDVADVLVDLRLDRELEEVRVELVLLFCVRLLVQLDRLTKLVVLSVELDALLLHVQFQQ